MKQFRLRRPRHATVVAYLALAVALGGTSYAAMKLPKNSVGSKQIRRNAVVSSKVKKDTLTGNDVNESRLGPVPSAGRAASAANADTATKATNATNATNADTVDNKHATDFVESGASAGGALTGTFSNLALADSSVDASAVANDTLTHSDIADYKRFDIGLTDSSDDSVPNTFLLDGTSGAAITGVCNRTGTSLTGSIVVSNPTADWAVTTDGSNGQADQVDLAAGAVSTLIQVGPTTNDHFSQGSFFLAAGFQTQISGFVSVRVNRTANVCDFSVVRLGE